MVTTLSRKDIPPRRRKQILDAARALFARSGYHGVTVDTIAAWSGISKGNLYWYFKSKQDILHLLFENMVETLTLPAQVILKSDISAEDKLRAFARSHLEAAEAHPDAVAIMLQVSCQQELNDLISSEYSLWMRHNIDLLTPLFVALGEKDAETVATLYATTIDSLMAMVAMGQASYDKEKILEVIEERFISFGGKKDG
ncbi:MAG: TetR/AcrR family transcriptional regulator [bacterium]